MYKSYGDFCIDIADFTQQTKAKYPDYAVNSLLGAIYIEYRGYVRFHISATSQGLSRIYIELSDKYLLPNEIPHWCEGLKVTGEIAAALETYLTAKMAEREAAPPASPERSA